MCDYIVRRFETEDAEEVSALVRKTLRITNIKDYSEESIEALVKIHTAEHILERASWTHFYVVCDKNVIIGCGAIGPYWGKEKESSLFTIFVLPEYQGKGVGRKIIETLEQDEFFLRAKRVEIPASITACEFYKKMGYDYKNGIDVVDEEQLYRLEKFRQEKMNFKKIEGLQDAYPAQIEGTSEWYYCKIAQNCFCDLYEAEEIVKTGQVYEGMTCVLIHFPDGKVFKPFAVKENVYVNTPVFWDGALYFLIVDFVKEMIQIVAFDTQSYEKTVTVELSLDEVEDCYNLMLLVAPVLLVRDGGKHILEVIWPEKKKFEMSDHEAMLFRDGEKVYFSEWYENPEYHERIITRDWNTGEVTESFDGQVCRMPNGDIWIM